MVGFFSHLQRERITMTSQTTKTYSDVWTDGRRTGWEIEINLMNGRTEKEEIQLFRLWANARSTHDGPRVHINTTKQKRINFHLKSRYYFLTFRRRSGDLEAAVGGLSSTCFLPLEADGKLLILPTPDSRC